MLRGLIQVAISTLCLANSAHSQKPMPPPQRVPAVAIDLVKIGWTPPPIESNRAFLKDFTLAKLLSVDISTRVLFLTEDVVVAYHSIQIGNDWRTAARVMEAFFISSRDGTLLSTHRWPTRRRSYMDDRFDSEARLIPLNRGRFLVQANGIIAVYNQNVELLKQRNLEPFSASDVWAAQPSPRGEGIVLRRASQSGPVAYYWLAADTLETTSHVSRPNGHSSDAAVADAHALYERTQDGLLMVDLSEHQTLICHDPLCRENGLLEALSAHYLGWSARRGIGVIDPVRGLVWSRSVQPKDHESFQFGNMKTALSGTRFGLWLASDRKASFDAVQIKGINIMIYDVADLNRRPWALRMKPTQSTWDFALSPRGAKLAVFDGSHLQIYSLD
jgi:hypothetical protein